MSVKPEIAALAQRIGAFHITDRAMKQAQDSIEASLRAGDVDARSEAAYLEAVRRYFSGFEKEARMHLRDVDRRLETANQVQFNLSAERGVAVKRIEATQGVLDDLRAIESPAP